MPNILSIQIISLLFCISSSQSNVETTLIYLKSILDPCHVEVGKIFVLKTRVKCSHSSEIPEIHEPSFKQFRLVGSYSTRNMCSHGSDVYVTEERHYHLIVNKTGVHEIGAFSAKFYYPTQNKELFVKTHKLLIEAHSLGRPQENEPQPIRSKVRIDLSAPGPPMESRVSIKAFVDKNKIHLGEKCRLTVEITCDEDEARLIQPLTFPRFSGFTKVASSSSQEVRISPVGNAELTTTTQEYVLMANKVGKHVIGPITTTFVDPRTKKEVLLKTEPIQVEVTPDIQTPAKKVALSEQSVNNAQTIISKKWPPLFVGPIVIALIIILIVGFAILSNKKRKSKSTSTIGEIKSNEEIILTELEALNSKWKEGSEREYLFGLSEILKWYLERKYNIKAMDVTSEEILLQLNELNLEEHTKSDVRRCLEIDDVVKFSEHSPTEEEVKQVYSSIKRLVSLLKVYSD